MLSPYSLSRPGGVQGQVIGLSRALRARGHEVTVVAPASDAGGGSRRHRGALPSSAGPPSCTRTGRWRRWRCGRVQRRGPSASSARAASTSLHRARAPGADGRLRPGAHGAAPHGRHLPPGGSEPAGCPCSSRWRSWWDGACRSASRSRRRHAETGLRSGGGDFEVLFNGVEMERFESAAPMRDEEGRPAVLFLGRHEQRKGLNVLLDAFAMLERPAVLWVAGDGPGTEVQRRRYPESDRVRWLGLLSDHEVAARLAGAAVLCAPSLQGESFGMVLLEGMAAGCAVVASDVEGYRTASGGHAALGAARRRRRSRPLAGQDPGRRRRRRGAVLDGGAQGGHRVRPGLVDGHPGRALPRRLRAGHRRLPYRAVTPPPEAGDPQVVGCWSSWPIKTRVRGHRHERPTAASGAGSGGTGGGGGAIETATGIAIAIATGTVPPEEAGARRAGTADPAAAPARPARLRSGRARAARLSGSSPQGSGKSGASRSQVRARAPGRRGPP